MINDNKKVEVVRVSGQLNSSSRSSVINDSLISAVNPSIPASKSKRQEAFLRSSKNMSSKEVVKKASLFGEIDPSQFRIVHMVG